MTRLGRTGNEPNVASPGRHDLAPNGSPPVAVRPHGKAFTYAAASSQWHRTTTMDGVAGFPFSCFLVGRMPVAGAVYMAGRWGSTAGYYDWLVTRGGAGNTSIGVLLCDQGTGQYVFVFNASVDPGTTWFTLGIGTQSYTEALLGNVRIVVNGVSVAASVGSQNPLTTTNGRGQFGIATQSSTAYDFECAGAAVWSRALTASEFRALHRDPFGMYRPSVGRVRGQAAAAGHAYYYRNFVAGAAL